MTKDDVLFGYRLQLFTEAARTNVLVACRTFGVHRSTYYAWKRQVDRHGLEMLRPRERRRPQMPNALAKMIEERIVAFSIAHPGLGPKRVASELAREKWGGIIVSPNGVWKGAVPSWPEHARQTPGANRRLRRAVRATA
jgi:transposase-like protein